MNIEKFTKIINEIKELSGNKQIEKLESIKKKNPEIFSVLNFLFHKTYNKKMNKYYVNDKKLKQIKDKIIPNENGKDINILLQVLKDLDKISNLYNGNERITGNNAIQYIITSLNKLNKEGQKIILDVLDNDLKLGLNIKTLNKVLEEKLPITPYHGGVKLEIKKLDKDIEKLNKAIQKIQNELKNTSNQQQRQILQEKLDDLFFVIDEKMDGMYCAINKDFSESRQGRSLYIEYIFANEIEKLNKANGKNNVLIGELLLKSIPNRKIANGIINSYTKILEKLNEFDIDYQNFNINNINKKMTEYKNNKRLLNKLKTIKKDIIHFKTNYGICFEDMPNEISYVIWDIIPENYYFQGYYDKPLIKRRKELEKLLKSNNIQNIKLVKYILTRNKLDIAKFTYDILNNGGEGSMIKNPESIFENNKSPKIKKVKIEITVDLEIIGFLTGTKESNKNKIESFICKTSDGKLITRPKGISDKEGKFLFKLIKNNLNNEELKNLEKYLYETSAEEKERLMYNIPDFLDKAIKNIENKYGTRIIEVKANGLSKSENKDTYSLDHPSFVEIRNDKVQADTLKDVKDNFKMHYQVVKLLGLSENMIKQLENNI